MNIYNDLVRIEFDKNTTPEELEAIHNRAADAASDLMLGINTIGNLMFWAADSDDYSEETAKKDMYRLGAMLMTLGEITRALSDTSANAAFSHSLSVKDLKARAGK